LSRHSPLLLVYSCCACHLLPSHEGYASPWEDAPERGRVGQTTHLAARMEQLATPGSILLTAETLQLAEGFIQVQALGPGPVKGLAAPVEVFELVGATAIRRGLQAAVARGLTRKEERLCQRWGCPMWRFA
jgi:hypothetical protein